MMTEWLDEILGLTEAELDAAIRAAELESRRQQARRAALLAVAEARRLFEADGHHSLKGYLRATCNWSNAVVARERRLAQLIDAIPAVGEALASGHISTPQALELAKAYANPRIGHLVREIAPVLLEHAEHLSYDDFKVCVDRFVMLADLDGAFDDVAADVQHRTARVSAVAGAVDVAASGGDPLTAAKLIGIFERFVEAEFRRDVDARRDRHGAGAGHHPLARTAAQRRFDALEAIFDAASSAPPGGRLPDPVVNIVCDERTLDDAFTRSGILLPNGGVIDTDELGQMPVELLLDSTTVDPAALLQRRCETASGVPIHPVLVLQAALTGHVRRVVVDSAGVVTDLGRKQRLFTGSARVAAKLLAVRCTHPGCDVAATFSDVDHADGWAADGATDQRNADIRCGRHDRHKHRHRWRTRRDASGRRYTLRPDGTVILPVGERPPDLTIDELQRVARARAGELRSRIGRQPA